MEINRERLLALKESESKSRKSRVCTLCANTDYVQQIEGWRVWRNFSPSTRKQPEKATTSTCSSAVVVTAVENKEASRFDTQMKTIKPRPMKTAAAARKNTMMMMMKKETKELTNVVEQGVVGWAHASWERAARWRVNQKFFSECDERECSNPIDVETQSTEWWRKANSRSRCRNWRCSMNISTCSFGVGWAQLVWQIRVEIRIVLLLSNTHSIVVQSTRAVEV